MSNTVVKVKTERTPNPNTLKYNFSRILNEFGTVEYSSAKDAENESPLGIKIFEVKGVENILIGANFISITKSEEISWDEVNGQLGPKLEEFFESEKPAVLNTFDNENFEKYLEKLSEEDKDFVKKIEQVLEEKVRPALAEDGGDIKLVGYDSELKIVYVKMQGACAGCPSARITLKEGVERTLIHTLGNDKIEKVIQV